MPLYLQVAQLLRQGIYSGAVKPGSQLESQNDMAADYGVSVDTARRALEVLREEGLIVTRRGTGSFALIPPPRTQITVGPDDVVTARMPASTERAELGIAEGVPVIAVRRGGGREELFDANRTDIIAAG